MSFRDKNISKSIRNVIQDITAISKDQNVIPKIFKENQSALANNILK